MELTYVQAILYVISGKPIFRDDKFVHPSWASNWSLSQFRAAANLAEAIPNEEHENV